MRMSTFPTILSVAIYLSTYANAYRYDERNEVYARELHNVDALPHEYTGRNLLSELSTRELVDELERRGLPLSQHFDCDYPGCKMSSGSANMAEPQPRDVQQV
ncbi:hypothetical protein DFP72DRAFT_847295 [Ephemerocybe angulata]|uniref:Uncharacterized protein n=1 Tax=Ephemerocybe angulata TaxID=980116 RepID=A0A8H6HYV6_9AGAR|nr:hypothetical protein DFP72DRAFT_847274 [Tulosesus angulatus]KAF6755560.1 hypothetical protein DFP72DRAFT_847295 [Tulosesus angulatus]